MSPPVTGTSLNGSVVPVPGDWLLVTVLPGPVPPSMFSVVRVDFVVVADHTHPGDSGQVDTGRRRVQSALGVEQPTQGGVRHRFQVDLVDRQIVVDVEVDPAPDPESV